MTDITTLRECLDVTLIRPNVDGAEVETFCVQCVAAGCRTMYVPPVFVERALKLVGSHGITVGTTAGFPFGNQSTIAQKIVGINEASLHGARWVDVCVNPALIIGQEWKAVADEVSQLTSAARTAGIGLKLIFETPYLTDEAVRRAAAIAEQCGAPVLKTATGIGTRVTERDVVLTRPILHNTQLKVAGGITTLAAVERFLDLGADKVGTSRGLEILAEARHVGEPADETRLLPARHPVIWLTGQSGAGKTTLAHALRKRIGGIVLDGDEMRSSISAGLGFSIGDRLTHNERVAGLARHLSEQGPVIVAVIAPLEEIRQAVGRIIGSGLLWVLVRGEENRGPEYPFETPVAPHVRVDRRIQTLEEEVSTVLTVLPD